MSSDSDLVQLAQFLADDLDIIDECGLTFLHVFPFSPRPGTPASRMPQVSGAAIRDRARRLRDKGKAKLDQFLSAEVGARRSILVETEATGRTEHFAPVKFIQALMPGAIVAGTITGRGANHLAHAAAISRAESAIEAAPPRARGDRWLGLPGSGDEDLHRFLDVAVRALDDRGLEGRADEACVVS